MPDPFVPPTSWCHDGDTITVNTPWNGIESQAELEQRHADLVAAGQRVNRPNC